MKLKHFSNNNPKKYNTKFIFYINLFYIINLNFDKKRYLFFHNLKFKIKKKDFKIY